MEKDEDVLAKIENDDFYKRFLDSATSKVLTQSLTIAEQVKKLGEGIDLISRELQNQVLNKHEDLLRQADHATSLENILNAMNGHVQNLFANAERLKNQITVPYNALESHTKVLGRMHLASHILRQVNRIQQLSRRLSNTNDPVQKAIILQELEQLASDPDLKDIDAVTAELRNIREQQQKVVKIATGSLNQGMKNENISQTTTALQIFINLGTIKTTTESFITNFIAEIKETFKQVFEISHTASVNKSKGGPGRANLGSSLGFRTKLWNELEKAFSEDIYHLAKQIKFLQNTLNNMNIPNVNLHIASDFWLKFNCLVQEEIRNSSSAIQHALEEDYPKLLKCYIEMINKLKYNEFKFSRQVLDKCENSYLSMSLSKMLDPTQAIFSEDNNVPSHDQVDSIIRIISNELSMVLIEEHLSEMMAKNVSKCIKLFAVKTEQQLETGPETAQVLGGTANAGQQKNVNFANCLYYMQVQVQRMLSNMKESMPSSSINVINESLTSLTNLIAAIMQPLVISINSAVETIIVTIHLETDWNKLQAPTNKITSCSPYMRELTEFIIRVYNTYLANFESKEVLSEKCSEIALRAIDLLVRHSSLLRPISQGGRARLQSDYSHLEQCLKVICPQLSDLGRPYRLLKSMALLVTMSPQEIIAGQAEGSSVPNSTILLMLFSFAGNELASPHQNTGWSLPKVSAWLDEHPKEEDRLDFIAGALQRYETLVRKKNSVNYDPVYPLMAQLLEAALKSGHKKL